MKGVGKGLQRAIGILALASAACISFAQPQLTHPRLAMSTATSGLITPISMAFIGPNDFLVLEKNTGQVKRVMNGTVVATVLDLPVNFASERGLLGIAVHPDFSTNGFVYLFWSESSTGADSGDTLTVPLLGNRVDQFVWNGFTLTQSLNIARLRAFQFDASNGIPRANHDGGVLAFGPDSKLYVMFGDVGRRGHTQNNLEGPVPDDQFGGPEADDLHYAGAIMRLNDDGSTPADNPFASFVHENPQVQANVRRTYAYGIRNSFGMAFDPKSGNLWFQENGEDAYDELNIAPPGMNSGWIQTMGPVSRVADYKAIETTSLHHEDFPNLQQLRWPPENISDTPEQALSRMFMLPGARYVDPVLSWRFVIAPAGIGFVRGRGLGPNFEGDLIVGCSTLDSLGGPLLAFDVTGNRRKVAAKNEDQEDRVVDNADFHDLGSSAENVIGVNFGIVTDVKMGPNGRLYVVSLDQGSVYEIHGR